MTETKLSFISLVASSVVLLLGDALQELSPDTIHWTICLSISFLLFIGGLPAIRSLMGQTGSILRLLVICILLIGALAGASMQVLFRANILLREAYATEAVGILSQSFALTLSTLVPGIFYPLGLILLSITLFLTKQYRVWKVGLLLLGAVLFPVGHAVGHPIALLGGDVLLVCAWFLLTPIFSTNFYETQRLEGADPGRGV